MPLYRFHWECHDRCLLDGEGSIVTGPDEAREACLRAVDRIRRVGSLRDAANWTLVVVNRARGTSTRIALHEIDQFDALDVPRPRLATVLMH